MHDEDHSENQTFEFTHITKTAEDSFKKLNGQWRRRFLQTISHPVLKSNRGTARYPTKSASGSPLYKVSVSNWRVAFRDYGEQVIIVFVGSHEDYNGFKDR